MRIAIYAATFVPNKDGVAKTLQELVSSIKDRGHEMAMWSSDVPDDVASVHGVHLTPSVPIFIYPAYRFGFFRLRNKKELDRFRPDIIHISTPDIAGLGFLRYGRKRGIPVSSVFHTDFPSYLKFYHIPFLESPLWYYLKRFYNWCDLVLAPTKTIEQKLSRKGIQNTAIWSRGIHLDRYNPSHRSQELRDRFGIKDETVFMFSGRFVHYKGVDILIKVYKLMMERARGKVKFFMIGSGPEEEHMKRSMPEAIFTGYITGTELYQAYASSDVFIFPSTTETFGNVVLEAMASGLPCVISDEGGCKELVEMSKGGLISRSNDPISFTENCSLLLDNIKLRNELRENALDFAKGRSWKIINDDLLNRYTGLIRTKPH